ncbi:MAG: hypothetical protein EA407_14790 [Rhodobacteraceae bacterium]|nr:MAG: hypothetical protein EA407_14790 [Paracoccaceae bacterium]
MTSDPALHVSRAELDAALPWIVAAPKDGGRVEMLCLRPDYGQRCFVPEITVTAERGIPGERWATRPWLRDANGAPHPGIQVCILSRRVLDLVWRARVDVPHPGDTFITDMDLSEANLPAGQRLALGSAVLEVSDIFNDACVKWAARYGAASREWINLPEHRVLRLRGILCCVVLDGRIRLGDELRKAAPANLPSGVDSPLARG